MRQRKGWKFDPLGNHLGDRVGLIWHRVATVGHEALPASPTSLPIKTASKHDASSHLFQLVDHAFEDREALAPEHGVAGVEAERRQQFGVVL